MVYRKQYDVVIQVSLQIAKIDEWLMAEHEIWMKVEKDPCPKSERSYSSMKEGTKSPLGD